MRGMNWFRAVAAATGIAAFIAAGVLHSTAASGAAGDLAATVDPAVVNIRTNLAYEGAAAAGTGIVIGPSGLILTNNHVIRGATSIRVTDVGNGRTYKGTVLGYDVAHDVALLRLSGASGLATATIGGTAKVGDTVTAFGNAGGVGGTPSSAAGSVTGLGRAITASDGDNSERLTGLIEINAALQPGDSGGPLVDFAGRVIGMNTAASVGFAFQDQTSSDAYAIPIAHALAIAKRIEAKQATATTHIGGTAMMGVGVAYSNDFGLGGAFDAATQSGATVTAVLPGSPAARVGLQQGDVITSVDGRAVGSSTTLTSVILKRAPGTTVSVRWVDAYGSSHQGTLKLASGPPQ
jgi:S1-C subfamily serine protease